MPGADTVGIQGSGQSRQTSWGRQDLDEGCKNGHYGEEEEGCFQWRERDCSCTPMHVCACVRVSGPVGDSLCVSQHMGTPVLACALIHHTFVGAPVSCLTCIDVCAHVFVGWREWRMSVAMCASISHVRMCPLRCMFVLCVPVRMCVNAVCVTSGMCGACVYVYVCAFIGAATAFGHEGPRGLYVPLCAGG